MTRVVAFHAFRGGTGKTTLAANAAAALALRGKRVAVIDADLPSPGIHTLFRVDPNSVKYTLNGFLEGGHGIADAALDITGNLAPAGAADAVPEGAAVFLVPAAIGAGAIAAILDRGYDAAGLERGCADLAAALGLDHILIDTHPGIGAATLATLGFADTMLLVLRPDIQDYQGTAVTLELARALKRPRRFLVINKALEAFDYAELSRRIVSNYRTPVAAVLPLTTDLAQIGSTGLIRTLQPEHQFARAIETLADAIA